MIGSSRVY